MNRPEPLMMRTRAMLCLRRPTPSKYCTDIFLLLDLTLGDRLLGLHVVRMFHATINSKLGHQVVTHLIMRQHAPHCGANDAVRMVLQLVAQADGLQAAGITRMAVI